MLQGLQAKDLLTLVLSVVAIVVSVFSFLAGLYERRAYAKRANRVRLGELVDELNQLDIQEESDRTDIEARNLANRASGSALTRAGMFDQTLDGAVYNARRDLLIQQAEGLLHRLPKRWITPSEYRTLALAMAEWGDRDSAEKYWQLAYQCAKKRSNSGYLLILRRGYALFLLGDPSRLDDGRRLMKTSLATSSFETLSLKELEREVETLQMWASAEDDDPVGRPSEWTLLLQTATAALEKAEASQDATPQRSAIPRRILPPPGAPQ